MIENLKHFIFGDPIFGGVPRSPLWSAVRKQHLKKFPRCAVTGSTTDLEVHHIKPYHLYPELELQDSNLITLTTKFGSLNVHLWFGHLGNFQSWNENVREDSQIWMYKIIRRP